MCVVGAYTINYGVMCDVWTLLIFSLFGSFAQKVDIEMAPFIIGFIPGPPAGVCFVKSLESFGTMSIFLAKIWIADFLWVLIAVSLGFSVTMSILARMRGRNGWRPRSGICRRQEAGGTPRSGSEGEGLAKRKSAAAGAGGASGSGAAVTMETIGRIAGVSQVTVSRALNHPDKVSPETMVRIREAIRLTGYVPNLTAASLASRRTHLIAALVPSITNIVYSTLIQRFIVAIRSAGYQVLLGETGFSQEEEFELVSALLSRRPDGFLLTGVHHSAECRRALLGANIPTVEVWDITETPIDVCVGFAHSEAGRAVARFVREKGYRNAAAVAAADERAQRRMEAFRERLSDYGFGEVPAVRLAGAASIRCGREALSQLLGQGFAEGVIFCSSDLLAHGILIEAAARRIAVPGKIAVIGFGDQDFAADIFPALTTVKVDREALGQKAADAMLRRLRGEPVETHRMDVGFTIVGRASG